MGFFKAFKNEFGKKTGKALGNKMYGAYADDKRVGVNRGKLKGESDGVKIVTSESQNRTVRTARESASDKAEREKNQKQLAAVLNIELNPTNKNALIKSLTTLSTYVDVGAKENSTDEHFIAAKSKFDTGVAMLKAIDPNNPMSHYFLQKKTEWKKKKKNENIGIVVLVVVCVVILAVVALFADRL